MLFEKKMIILSGAGKGVVLIERNGLGVKFALRTFGVHGELMAGIVTPERVIVRDLPKTPDPAAVFYVDQMDLHSLHFAVFGSELVLYGAIGERMWTSNLMDILRRHSGKPAVDYPVLPSLGPIAEKPKTLPLPDGSGRVQSRLSIYGDDAIAADNFYTGIDIESTVPRIDAFLDGPRLTSGDLHAPRSEPVGFSVGMSESTATLAESEAQENPSAVKETDMSFINESVTEKNAYTEAATDAETVNGASDDNLEAATPFADTEQGDTAEGSAEIMPWWKREAEYIKSLSTREIMPKISVVQKSTPTTVKKIREVTFFERKRPDIDKLFSGAPEDREIKKLLGGEWVKVTLDGGAVSVGRVDDGVICYAVPGTYEKTSPIGESAQWLPKVAATPTGKGYWLIFQNLVTGEIIK